LPRNLRALIYEKETEKGPERYLKIRKMSNQEYLENELSLKKQRAGFVKNPNCEFWLVGTKFYSVQVSICAVSASCWSPVTS